MIKIGLTGWSDHEDVYSKATSAKDKLFDYSGHFPIVELDTAFYAIPKPQTVEKWCQDTPKSFQFVMKTYQGMTGHLRDELPYDTREEMFNAFRESADVFASHNKLGMVLIQFPPWFDCTTKNVNYILYMKKQLSDYPLAIEFRNQTWYAENMREKTFAFLKDNSLIHTVVDEPQVGVGSAPLVPIATHDKVLFRLHGRNVFGWRNIGHGENWRKVRFLYDYNKEELEGIKQHLLSLQEQAKEVFVLFNNNSGGHAAKNAKMFQKMLAIQYDGLSPMQLNLFEGD